MSKTKKILIGFATFLAPILHFSMFPIINSVGPVTGKNGLESVIAMILVAFGILYVLVCVGGYCAFVTDSKKFNPKQKKVWIVSLILFNVAAMPLFWFLHIWNEPNDQTNK